MQYAWIISLGMSFWLVGCQQQPGVDPEMASPTPASLASPSTPNPRFQGTHLFEQTFERMPEVKAKLHCSSCHLDGGRVGGALPLVNVAKEYPEYSARAGKEISLEERVNECFERNMNGPALAVESEEMSALLLYIEGLESDSPLARGIAPLEEPPAPPDIERGRALYQANCLDCHGTNGGGSYQGSTKNYLYPALWGDDSFTTGSEMARSEKLAAFIAAKMPLGRGELLSPQQSWDIAAYVAAQPRPDFAKKDQDYPAPR